MTRKNTVKKANELVPSEIPQDRTVPDKYDVVLLVRSLVSSHKTKAEAEASVAELKNRYKGSDVTVSIQEG